jgi:hypothetical protein
MTLMSFHGRLRALILADILEFLRVLNRPGLLSLTSGGAAVGLYLRDAALIGATSTRPGDRLVERLLGWGRISGEQHEAVLVRVTAGEPMFKALQAASGLAPRELVEARARRARQIALELFEWNSGSFTFIEGEAPGDEAAGATLPLLELITDGIRQVANVDLVRERIASPDWVFEPLPDDGGRARPRLEPHEDYVRRLVDGARTVGEVVRMSEFTEPETLRTLFLLFSTGWLVMKARPAREDAADEDLAGVIARYNGMFGRVHAVLMREVGPITEPLLEKALRSLRPAHPVLFASAALGGDGTIDPELLRRNLRGSPPQRRSDLVQGLNELLYAELLLLRRTLGPEHETRLLRELRLDPARSGGAEP